MKQGSILLLLFFAIKICFGNNFFTLNVGCHDDLNSLKQNLLKNEAIWWTELGEKLLIKGTVSTERYIQEQKIPFKKHDIIPSKDSQLLFVRRFHSREFEEHELNSFGQIIEQGYGFAIFQLYSTELLSNQLYTFSSSQKIQITNFRENFALVSLDCNTLEWKSVLKDSPDPQVQAVVDSINMTRWSADLQYLSSLNRYMGNSQINTAKNYIINSLSSNPNMVVTQQDFNYNLGVGTNVIGTIQGSVAPDTWIIVGAHYDSISQSVSTASPGAEDNGSGTVSVLELARIFTKFPPEVTMIFVLYAAEEQGLYGSEAHAIRLVQDGDANKVKIVHTMDMVAYRSPDSPTERVLLESSSKFQYLFPPYTSAASLYTLNNLGTAYSSNPFGSDHVPYINRNIPALLCIDNDWDSYPYYHRTTDTFDKLNLPIATDILRMNAATLFYYANASYVPDASGATSFISLGAVIPVLLTLLV